MNIRRQGHLADLRQVGFNWLAEADQAAGTFQRLDDFNRGAAFDCQMTPGQDAFAADKRFPGQEVKAANEQQFNPTTGVFMRKDAGRNDPGLIDDQNIAGMQILTDLREDRMLQCAAAAGKHQQARCITGLDGRLSNPLGRQMVIKVGCPHLDQPRLGGIGG